MLRSARMNRLSFLQSLRWSSAPRRISPFLSKVILLARYCTNSFMRGFSAIWLIVGLFGAGQAQTITRVSQPGIIASAVDIADNGLVLGIVPDEVGNLLNPTAFIWDNAGVRTPLLGGDFVQTGVSAINNSGTVVGTCNTLSTTKAVVWRNGVPMILPDLGVGARANDINNQGEIAGVVYRPEDLAFMPAKWNSQGELIQLDPSLIPGTLYQPFGTGEVISDNGTIAGVFSNPQWPVSFAFWNGDAVNFRIGGDFVMLNAGGINSEGTFAGSGFAGGDGRQSFTINSGAEVSFLSSSTGYSSSEVNGINDANDVVGYSIDRIGEIDFATVGTFWQGGTAYRVTLPPGVYSSLADVNANRIAVGTITDGEDTYIAKFDLASFAPTVDIDPLPRLTPGTPVTISAHARNGAESAGQWMQFQWDQVSLGSAKADANGVARMTYKVPLNASQRIHDVMASLGESRYLVIGAPVLKGDVVIQTPRPRLTPTGTRIQVVLRNSGTKDPLAFRDITVILGDRTFTRRTNAAGVASLVVPRLIAPRGVRSFSVDVPETPSHKAAFATYRR